MLLQEEKNSESLLLSWRGERVAHKGFCFVLAGGRKQKAKQTLLCKSIHPPNYQYIFFTFTLYSTMIT